MAELVKQRHHVRVAKLRCFTRRWRREIADEVGDRQGAGGADPDPRRHLGHPRATALVVAGKEVAVEATDLPPVGGQHGEVAYVRVPGADRGPLADRESVQAVGYGEHALQHARQREPWPQPFLGDVEALGAQQFGVVADVPGLEAAAGIRLEFGVFGARTRQVALGEFVEEADDGRRVGRHLRRQRQVGIVGVAEQARGLVPRSQDLRHDRAVVEAPGARSLVRGPRVPGLIEVATQRDRMGVVHDGGIGRVIERQRVAALAATGGGLAGAGDDVRRQSLELRFIRDRAQVRLGRIEDVFLEARLQRRQFLHQLLVAGLFRGRQVHTGETELAQRVGEHPLALRIELRALEFLDGLVGAVERVVLADLGVVLGEERQADVVGRPQFLVVGDGVEVADRGKQARQPVVHLLDRLDQRRESRRRLRQKVGQLRPAARQLRGQGRDDMGRTDCAVIRQVDGVFKRVGVGHS